MRQYTNKNGMIFGVIEAESSTMAYINGNYVAQAETEKELENILDHFSHANPEITKRYLGLKKEKTAD